MNSEVTGLPRNSSRFSKPENRLHPLKFIDSLDIGKHIVLFYGEPEYGRMIEFRFINNGLLNGQHCIYLTHGDVSFVEKEMSDSGIDIDIYKRKNLLHVHHIPNVMDDPEGGIKAAHKIWERITADLEPPFRIVGRWVPELDTEEQRMVQLDIERFWQGSFSKLQCSFLCPYPTEKIVPNLQGKWIADILQCHHDAIFAPKFAKGTGMNMR